MKYYTLQTINNGQTANIHKQFKTRNQAINYAFRYFARRYAYNLQVEEEFAVDGNKHDIEYVLDYYNRFRVNRVELQLNH